MSKSFPAWWCNFQPWHFQVNDITCGGAQQTVILKSGPHTKEFESHSGRIHSKNLKSLTWNQTLHCTGERILRFSGVACRGKVVASPWSSMAGSAQSREDSGPIRSACWNVQLWTEMSPPTASLYLQNAKYKNNYIQNEQLGRAATVPRQKVSSMIKMHESDVETVQGGGAGGTTNNNSTPQQKKTGSLQTPISASTDSKTGSIVWGYHRIQASLQVPIGSD